MVCKLIVSLSTKSLKLIRLMQILESKVLKQWNDRINSPKKTSDMEDNLSRFLLTQNHLQKQMASLPTGCCPRLSICDCDLAKLRCQLRMLTLNTIKPIPIA